MHPTRRRFGALVGALLALSLIAAACGGGGDTAPGSEVIVSGSSTVEPISALNGENFAAENPEIAVTVDGPGTGDGFELFCNGETDISDASRPIKDEEAETCAANGIEYVELKVGIDGMAVLTSPDNDAVDCLSFLDLYALVGPESQGFGTWDEADELAGELAAIDGIGASHAPYPDADLVVTGPGEESGTFDSFVELAIEGIADERGEDPTTRPDYTSSPNDNVIVQGIEGSPTSLGWVGYAFFAENEGALKALAVDGGDGCVEPTPETIASGEYPLARPLFIYVNLARAAESDAVSAYVDYYLSDAGRESVSEVGYVQLTDEEWTATTEAWEAAKA